MTTFVIGFSVNGSSTTGGDGFPAPYNTAGKNNCKAWYNGVGNNPTAMAAACATAPPPGSTAEACCELNRIAYEGSGGASAPASAPAVGPFFAESQADINLSFGRILASITKSVATRTVPAFTPAVYSSTGFGAGAMTAQYLGSFIPNAQKPWSGEILRERSVCGGDPFKANAQDPSITAGDSMAINLAAQTAANRLFFTMVPERVAGTSVVDAARTVRPFAATSTDGVPVYRGTERSASDWGLWNATDMRLALDIDRYTCKRGRAASSVGNGTVEVPALDLDSGEACSRVVMGFATAHFGAINETGTVPGGSTTAYDFNVRCKSLAGSASAGRCSISNNACDVSDPTGCAAIPGQVCVPDCAPLGAIFRANPVVNGPPDALLRDAGYRAFQAKRSKRKPTLFAATTDGILHAFKAVETAPAGHHELWSFIPPAVLPRLASNYPAGNQILLDGTPVVKDTVWERAPGDLDVGAGSSPGAKWHTTLVAGLGVSGGGYYAVNVTDSDCNAKPGSISGECITPNGDSGYQAPAANSLDEAGAGDYSATGGSSAKRGPHFLWQLTDVTANGTSDPARVTRRAKDGKDMVALFGRNTGTPAITTLQIQTGAGAERQVGVAILPGGIDGTPVKGASCNRTLLATDLAHDTARGYRSAVRRWAQNCSNDASSLTTNAAVPGRGITIVRLDTGEIIRHFGRRDDMPDTDLDFPRRHANAVRLADGRHAGRLSADRRRRRAEDLRRRRRRDHVADRRQQQGSGAVEGDALRRPHPRSDSRGEPAHPGHSGHLARAGRRPRDQRGDRRSGEHRLPQRRQELRLVHPRGAPHGDHGSARADPMGGDAQQRRARDRSDDRVRSHALLRDLRPPHPGAESVRERGYRAPLGPELRDGGRHGNAPGRPADVVRRRGRRYDGRVQLRQPREEGGHRRPARRSRHHGRHPAGDAGLLQHRKRRRGRGQHRLRDTDAERVPSLLRRQQGGIAEERLPAVSDDEIVEAAAAAHRDDGERMGARRRLIAVALASLASIGAPACKQKEKEQAPPAPAPSARPSADRLAEGEIPEGRDRAFTLPLPLHSTVKARFAGSVHVASSHTQEELANFVRARVTEGKSSSGTTETHFEMVIVTKDPAKRLTIDVRAAPIVGDYRSQMVISDVTPAPEEPGLTDEDRWKKAGMTPDGKLIDRNHLQ